MDLENEIFTPMIRIVKEKTRYYDYAIEAKYSQETVSYWRELKEKHGWQNFSWNDGKWRFKNPSVALEIKDKFPLAKIENGIISQAKEEVKLNILNEKREVNAGEIKKRADSQLVINGIKGTLYPYQKVGVEFFVNSGGKAMLCDEPGVGKSAQTLAYLVYTKKKRTLVVCPASVKFSWENEVKKWTELKSQVIDGKTDFRTIDHDTNVVIVNYDVLKKLFNELMKIEWDCVVGDESHLIKNNKAQRTKAFKAIAKNSKSLLLLSGTPVLSRPVELWNALQLMDEKTWNNYWDFTRRYCGAHQTRWGLDVGGATNLEELQQRISRYFLRRRKEDVLKELPEKVFIDVPVDMDNERQKEYDTAEKEFARYLRDYKKKKYTEITKAMTAEKLTKINFLRQISVWGKVNSAREMIEGIVDSGQKVLVFSSFNAPLEKLMESFPGSVMITGKTDVSTRGEIVNKFQTDESVKVFFGGTTAAGVGITLTAASYVIFLDYSWNPADMEQALNRAHRPGTTATHLTIYQIYSKGTIDEFMKKLLVKKQKVFDKIIDGDKTNVDISTDEFIDGVLSLYSEEL